MVEFLFFRHGETDWNLRQIFQGHTDISLNATGVLQAQGLADRVRFWKPDLILCSDLTRALRTAEFCQLDWKVPLITSADLREMHLGQAEGVHRDDVMKMVGVEKWEQWNSFLDTDEDFCFPGGETKIQARDRVRNYLHKFSKENPQYKRIAVSTHGGILRRMIRGLKGAPDGGVPIPNCVTYRLDYDGFNWQFINVRERTSAVVVAENKILTFFAVDPFSGQEFYFLPGGKIEASETIQDCAKRECLEETGYHVVPEDFHVTSEYDFTWNNQNHWCRTHFLKAELKGDIKAPKPVQDAAYNKGIRWIPKDDFSSYFRYNESVFESIKKLIS